MMSSTTVGCYVFRQKAPNSRQKQRKIQASYVTRNSSRQKFDIDQLFLLAIPADFKESDPENWKLQAIRNLCSLHKYYAQYVHYAAFKTSKIWSPIDCLILNIMQCSIIMIQQYIAKIKTKNTIHATNHTMPTMPKVLIFASIFGWSLVSVLAMQPKFWFQLKNLKQLSAHL